jgi:hypothetical protein
VTDVVPEPVIEIVAESQTNTSIVGYIKPGPKLSESTDQSYWFLIILFVIMIGFAQIIDYLIFVHNLRQ